MARKSIYKQKWRVVECGSEDCWCRMVVTPSWARDNDVMEACIIGAGEIDTRLAKYIAKLHNKELGTIQPSGKEGV